MAFSGDVSAIESIWYMSVLTVYIQNRCYNRGTQGQTCPSLNFLFILKWIADKKKPYFILKNYKCSIQTLQSTVRSVYYSVLHFIHSSNFSGNEVISGDIDSKPVASKTGMRKDACELSFFQI